MQMFEKNFMQISRKCLLSCFFCFCFLFVCLFIFWRQKQLVKASQTCTFIPPSLRSEQEERYTLRLLLMRDQVRCQQEPFVPIASNKSVPKDLKKIFRSKFNHGFINCSYLHCAILKAQKARDMQFFLHNVQYNMLFKYNMK